MRDTKLYLLDIKESITRIQSYTRDVNLSEFEANSEKIDAVVRNLEIIGEAVKGIPSTITAKYPDIQWQDIVGMRNILVHDYFGVDVQIVWRTVQERLPSFLLVINSILMSLPQK